MVPITIQLSVNYVLLIWECVHRYQLSARDTSASDGNYYDTKEAAIFKVGNANSSGSGGDEGSSGGQSSSGRSKSPGNNSQRASEDGTSTIKEGQRSEAGGVAKTYEGVASLEDLYGASTDDESDSEGMHVL